MKEKILWIGGSQPRHLYYVNEMAKDFNVVAGVEVMRGNLVPNSPEVSDIDKLNWIKHFEERAVAEHKYFGKQKEPKISLLRVDKETLNSESTAKFIRDVDPKIVLIFGSGMLREPLMSALPHDTINLHLGLSPRYRGAATLFWPFYFLEPNWVGTTFHYIVSTPDGGDIIHQVTPEMKKDDGVHDLSCRAVLDSVTEARKLVGMYPNWKHYAQKPESGKNFLESDFKPQHLRMIYNVYDNNIVNKYLEGEIKSKSPNLKRQW